MSQSTTASTSSRHVTSSGELSARTQEAQSRHQELLEITQALLPAFGPNWNRQGVTTLTVSTLSRLLYLNDIYRKIVDVPGVICEFGVHWGASMAQLINLRSIYEPFNNSRTIYGFDTFEGFLSLHEKDGEFFKPGDYASRSGHEELLERILSLHESFTPQANLRKFGLIKGDATVTVDTWLADNPHAIISLAIFDMDLYEPTQKVLEKILPRLVKGSVLVFDEINHPLFPGETRALDEVMGLNNLRLRKSPLHPHGAWVVYGE